MTAQVVSAQDLDRATISSGGALDLKDPTGTYQLQDLKGQAAAGSVTNGTTTVEIGAIYVDQTTTTSSSSTTTTTIAVATTTTTSTTTTTIALPSGPDSGLINHAQIERVSDTPGSGIRLKWLYSDALAVKRADIWRLAGAGETYSANKTWLLAAADLSATEWTDNFKDAANNEVKVGNNINAYYRVIPAGTVPGPSSADPKIFDPLSNEKTLGKVDIVLKEQYNAITAPFKLDNYALSALIGEQLAEGDQIHYWNDRAQAYNIMTKTANWPSYTFKEIEGFFVYLSDPQNKGRREYLTVVGFVGGFPAGFTWPLGKEYNLLGYPYPGSDLANTLGFRPNEGDQFHQWNWASQGFSLTTYVGGQWKDETVTVFALGEGKFYYVPLTSPTDKWELKF